MNLEVLKWFDMARIDIKNQGEGNDVNISVPYGNNCNIIKPEWFSRGGTGYVLHTSEQHQLIELECCGEGNLLIRLLGICWNSSEGVRLPLWVDYTRMAINDEVIFWELKPQWHDKAYTFNKHVTDGENVKVEISWSYHGYKGEELVQLLSLLCTVPKL